MDNRDVKTLQILEAIEDNDAVSQRTLAHKLDVSLGLVNSFVKHLAAKGFFKIMTFPKERARYVLTPEGIAEKTRLVYTYMKYSFNLYKKSYESIHDMLHYLESEGVSDVALFGMGVISEMIFQEVSKAGIKVTALIDDTNKGLICHGKMVIGICDVKDVAFERIIVTEFDNREYSIENIVNVGVPRSKIVTLDQRKYS